MVIGIDASRANTGQRTGTERYAFELTRRLSVRCTDHDVRLYLREEPRADLIGLGAHVQYRVLRWPPGILWSHLRLSWELWRHPPDILFVPADTVPLVHPRRTTTTIHDVAFERFPELYQGTSVQRRLGWLQPFVRLFVRIWTWGKYGVSERDYHRWSVRHAVRSCPQILTVSDFSKQEIMATLQVDPWRIIVTPLGVKQPPEYLQIDQHRRQVTLQRLQLTRPFFLYVGRLEQKKNIAHLIRGYRQFIRSSTNPPLLALVGQPGYGWPVAEQLLADQDLRRQVRVLGWQPSTAVEDLQVSARIFVFVSRYEGFGIPALESLSAGVPVIASRAGSLPEILGSAAYYVSVDDVDELARAFQRLHTEDTQRQELISRGRDRATQYTWERTAAATMSVLFQ